MGTMGFAGFVVDGVEKIFVNHKDSYPSGLGVSVLDWLTDNLNAVTSPIPGGIPDRIRSLRTVPSYEDVSRLEVARVRGLLRESDQWRADQAVIDRASTDELLEYTTYDLTTLLRAGVMVDGSEFASDSLLAEWGYLIDLDLQTFEVFRGLQEMRHSMGRFADRPSDETTYQPVALVAAWFFDSLPARSGLLSIAGAH